MMFDRTPSNLLLHGTVQLGPCDGDPYCEFWVRLSSSRIVSLPLSAPILLDLSDLTPHVECLCDRKHTVFLVTCSIGPHWNPKHFTGTTVHAPSMHSSTHAHTRDVTSKIRSCNCCLSHFLWKHIHLKITHTLVFSNAFLRLFHKPIKVSNDEMSLSRAATERPHSPSSVSGTSEPRRGGEEQGPGRGQDVLPGRCLG